MMPSLMIDHLSINLRSGTDNLVSEISFAIKEGESLILLGQSGSGKTMTCSAVLNLLDPKKFKVSGSVFFGETDLLNSSEKQRRGIYGNQIVYIPQNPMTALDPSMRIGRQMDETLRLHSDKSRQQRYNYILRLLHDVGLDDPDRVYRAYPHMLSGGMLQRVIIAMAMMLDAKFVLADEPTTALDVIHRNGFLKMNQDYDLVLTDSGRAIASCIYEKHCYFKDRLISAGVSPETAEIEACRLEHCVSEESFHKLRKTYGY